MLKRNHLAIVYITERTFWVGVSNKKSIDLYEVSWNGEDLTTPFSKLKEQFSVNEVKIILGNSLSQIAVLKQSKDKLNREAILTSVKELFAEDVQDLSFDWKSLEDMGDYALIEITAAPNFLLQHIKEAAATAKISITAIKPISVLLAEQTKELSKPHLIIWRKQEALALIAHEGFVYQARDIETYAPQRIQALLNFNLEHAGLPIEQAVLSWSEAALDQAKPAPEMPPTITATTQKELDVIKFFIEQKPGKGKDASVLDLLRENQPDLPEEEVIAPLLEEKPSPTILPPSKMPIRNFSLEGSSNPSPLRWLVIIILVLATAGATALGGYYFLTKPSDVAQTTSQISPSPIISPILEPTAEPIDLKTLTIEILNGSGVPGEAGKVESLLINAGFGDAQTGNADSYDYEKTEIMVSEKVTTEATQLITKALEEYELNPVEVSSSAAEFDISIVVGSTKK
jgi:hypothetical protein